LIDSIEDASANGRAPIVIQPFRDFVLQLLPHGHIAQEYQREKMIRDQIA
jgi:hypothetical protein